MAKKKEMIFDIKDGSIEANLGAGWPQGAEAANEVGAFIKGFGEVTVKRHRPHQHQEEEVRNEVGI